jgi:outer membrane lipoprotein-sorting protein
MIRILIDEVGAIHGRKGHHRKRLYKMEIVTSYNTMTNSKGYSVWLYDDDRNVVNVVRLIDVAYPEYDPLKLVAGALAALKGTA